MQTLFFKSEKTLEEVAEMIFSALNIKEVGEGDRALVLKDIIL